MSDQDFEEAVGGGLPSEEPQVTPGANVSPNSGMLRPRSLNDRPVIPNDDLEVRERRLQREIDSLQSNIRSSQNAQRSTPDYRKFQSGFDPRYIENPYVRDRFRDEIDERNRADEEAVRRAEAAQRDNIAAQQKIQRLQQEKYDERLAAERERAWNIANLEKARTGREYIEDPINPGYPRPVLSDEEWAEEERKRLAEEQADVVADKKAKLTKEFNANKASLSAIPEASDPDFEDDFEKKNEELRLRKLDELTAQIEEAEEEIGGFLGFGKDKAAEEKVNRLKEEQESLLNIGSDRRATLDAYGEEPEFEGLGERFEALERNEQIQQENEKRKQKSALLQDAYNRWSGTLGARGGALTDEEFEYIIQNGEYPPSVLQQDAATQGDQTQAPINPDTNLSEQTPFVQEAITESRRQDVLRSDELIAKLEASNTASFEDLQRRRDEIASLTMAAGTTQYGAPIRTPELIAAEQAYAAANIEHRAGLQKLVNELAARKEKHKEFANTVKNLKEIPPKEQEPSKPVGELSIEQVDATYISAAQQDIAARKKALREQPAPLPASMGGPQPTEQLRRQADSLVASEQALIADRLLLQDKSVKGKVALNGEVIGFAQERKRANGESSEIFNIYADKVTEALPLIDGKPINVIQRPNENLEILKAIYGINVYDPDKEYKAPGRFKPEVVNAIREDVAATFRGKQTATNALDPALTFTSADIDAVASEIPKFHEEVKKLKLDNSLTAIQVAVANGKISAEEGERKYKAEFDKLYGANGLGDKGASIANEILRMRDAAFAGGGDLMEVLRLGRMMNMSAKPPVDFKSFSQDYFEEQGIASPISSDHADALQQYIGENGNLLLFNRYESEETIKQIVGLQIAEDNLKKRIAIRDNPRRDFTSQPLTEIEQQLLDDEVRAAAGREGFTLEARQGLDLPLRFVAGVTQGTFGMEGISQSGHLLGSLASNVLPYVDLTTGTFSRVEPQTAFNELARRPFEQFVEPLRYLDESGQEQQIDIFDNNVQMKTGLGFKGNMPKEINAIQYLEALRVFRKSDAYKSLSDKAKQEVETEYDSIDAYVGNDISDNPIVRSFEAIGESLNFTDPRFDQNTASQFSSGVGSMVAFMLPSRIAVASLSKTGGSVRLGAKGDRLFNLKLAPKQLDYASKPWGLTAGQGAAYNSMAAFDQIEQRINIAAQNPDVDVSSDLRNAGTLLAFAALGMTEGIPIAKGLDRLRFSKLPPTLRQKAAAVAGETITEGAQEGGLSYLNLLVGEAVLPAEFESVNIGDEVKQLQMSYGERFMSRFDEEEQGMLMEAGIGSSIGLIMALATVGAVGRRSRNIQKSNQAELSQAEEAAAALAEALDGPNAASVLQEYMPEGVTITEEDVAELQLTFGGSESASAPGQNQVEYLEQELARANEEYGFQSGEAEIAFNALKIAKATQSATTANRMGAQIVALKEYKQQSAELDAAIDRAETNLRQAQEGGLMPANAVQGIQNSLNDLLLQKARLDQLHAATKMSQSGTVQLSNEEKSLLEQGAPELGLPAAVEAVEAEGGSVPIILDNAVAWAAEAAPANRALIEMSEAETRKRIADGVMKPPRAQEYEDLTPTLEGVEAAQEQTRAERERREQIPVDPEIANLPKYNVKQLMKPRRGQKAGEQALRSASAALIDSAVSASADALPNLSEEQRYNISGAIVEQIIETVSQQEAAFKKVQVGRFGGTAAVEFDGSLKIDPELLINQSLQAISSGASVAEAVEVARKTVLEESTHNIIRRLVGDQAVAGIWERLPQELKDLTTQSYFAYTINKAKRQRGIDLTNVPVNQWPAEFEADIQRASNSTYMGHEYLNMVVEAARDGQVGIAQMLPNDESLWEKIVAILENLVGKLNSLLTDKNVTDPGLRREIENLRDLTIQAQNFVEAGLIDLFAETRTDEQLDTPAKRLEYVRQAAIPQMVAAQYRNVGISPEILVAAANVGVSRAVQKPENFREEVVRQAQKAIEERIADIIPDGAVMPLPLRPDVMDFLKTQTPTTEQDAKSQGDEVLRKVIAKLPKLQAEVFEKSYIENKSNENIAAELGKSTKAVENILQRAKENVAKILTQARRERDAAAQKTQVPESAGFGDQSAAPREWPEPETVETISLAGMKEDKPGEQMRMAKFKGGDLIYTDDPETMEALDYDGSEGAIVTGVFRQREFGVRGMEMLAWLRSRIDGPIYVEGIVESAEGFYQRAEEYNLIDGYEPHFSELYTDDELDLQFAAMRGENEELTAKWSTSHPLTRDYSGLPTSFFRGHFDNDLFNTPSRHGAFLGSGLYFTTSIDDANNYADVDLHPDNAKEFLEFLAEETADNIEADNPETDSEQADNIAKALFANRFSPRITPVYLHGQKWAILDPSNREEMFVSAGVEIDVDRYREDILADLQEDYAYEQRNGNELLSFEGYLDSRGINEEYFKSEAIIKADELGDDIPASGEAIRIIDAAIDVLQNNDQIFDAANQRAIESLVDSRFELIREDARMSMTDFANDVFEIFPLSFRNLRKMSSDTFENGGEVFAEALKLLDYDGVIMSATAYFPRMEVVQEQDTWHALVWNAKPVYGMFGGLARKRRDPLQYAAQRVGVEVKPNITSEKSDLINVVQNKIYSQDMGVVIVRELLQNSLDAIRPDVERGNKEGSDNEIVVLIDEENRTLTIEDTGHGMPPERVASALIDITKSFKETGGAGGYGLAKAVIFGNSDNFTVETMFEENDGSFTKTIMTGDGQSWLNTINDKPNGVSIVANRNAAVSSGAETVVLKNTFATTQIKDINGFEPMVLPLSNVLPKGFSLEVDDYNLFTWKIDPNLIPDIPKVFRERQQEVVDILQDYSHPLRASLDSLASSYFPYPVNSLLSLNAEIEDYEYRKKNGAFVTRTQVASDENLTLLEAMPVFDPDNVSNGSTDKFFKALGQLPPPLRDRIVENFNRILVDTNRTPIEIIIEDEGEDFFGEKLGAKYSFGGQEYSGHYYLNQIFEQRYMELDPSMTALEDMLLEEFPKNFSSEIITVNKPSSYTKITTQIPTQQNDNSGNSISFDFDEAEKTANLIAVNDPMGVRFSIGKNKNNAKAVRRSSEPLSYLGTKNDEGTKYTILQRDDISERSSVKVNILNRGIWQFSKHFHFEASIPLPSSITIDVSTTIDPKSNAYPFNAGRDNFSTTGLKAYNNLFNNYRKIAAKAKVDKLISQYKNSPNLKQQNVKTLKVFDVTASNADLAVELSQNDLTNQVMEVVQKYYDKVSEHLKRNGFESAAKSDLIGINVGMTALGVNFTSSTNNTNAGVFRFNNNEYGITVSPFRIYQRIINKRQAAELGLDQYGDDSSMFAAELVTTLLHELTHNSGYGDADAEYSYVLTRNITRMGPMYFQFVEQLADDVNSLFEAGLGDYLSEALEKESINNNNEYKTFINGTPTGLTKEKGQHKDFSFRESFEFSSDREPTQSNREGDQGAAERGTTFEPSLPDIQKAASNRAKIRRSDAFGLERDFAGRLVSAPEVEWPQGSGENGAWNVLSLFDGIAAGAQAIKNLGIPIDNYYSSEIEESAIKIQKANHDFIEDVGDVQKLKSVKMAPIDLLWGGSPCQGFSCRGKRAGMADPRSALFWEFVKQVKGKKPKFFLLENNASMKKEDQAVITEALGVSPVRINSKLSTGALRDRLYWANFPITQPKDMGVKLIDVIDQEVPQDAFWNQEGIEKLMSYVDRRGRSRWNMGDHHDVKRDKARAITRNIAKGAPKNLLVDQKGRYRKITLPEVARLMGFPDGYLADVEGVSNTAKYQGIGNSWSVPVIEHILMHTAQEPISTFTPAKNIEVLSHQAYLQSTKEKCDACVKMISKSKYAAYANDLLIGEFLSDKQAENALNNLAPLLDLKIGDYVHSINSGGKTFSIESVQFNDLTLEMLDQSNGEITTAFGDEVYKTELNSAVRPFPETFPDAHVNTTLSFLRGKEGSDKRKRHESAKAGDTLAATQIAIESIKPEIAQEVANNYPNSILVFPDSQEMGGTNAIPAAAAAALADMTGLEVDEKIVELVAGNHTDANAIERLFRVPEFGGEVQAGRDYVIIDDVLTTGSTVNEIRKYIERNGGNPVAVFALAASHSAQTGNSRYLKPRAETVAKLDRFATVEKSGQEVVDELLSKYGLPSIDSLTNSQVAYLGLGKRDAAALEAVLEAGRQKEDARRNAQAPQATARRTNDLWGIPQQEFTSADTSRGNSNRLPRGYTYLEQNGLIRPGQVVLDIGTGPYRHADKAVARMGGVFYSYEPYFEERAADRIAALKNAVNGQSDIVVSNNALNVIKEKANQRKLILQAENALKPGGTFYVTIYKAKKEGPSGDDSYQAAEPEQYYEELIADVFGAENVSRKEGVITAIKPSEQQAATRETPSPSPLYISAMQTAIDAKMPEKAGVDQVGAIIGNWQVHEGTEDKVGKMRRKFPATQREAAEGFAADLPGVVRWQGSVTQEEIEASGVLDFLEGQRSLSKKEVLDFIKTSQPIIREIDSADKNDVTRYEEYATDGGENYREILFIYKPEGENTFNTHTGSHWDQENVMFHARVSDRYDTQGRKVMYVNEIQSDWHQRGRNAGYITAAEDAAFQKAEENLMKQAAGEFGFADYDGFVDAREYVQQQIGSDKPDWADAADWEIFTAHKQKMEQNPVPYAPWGNSWPKLATNRLVQMAAQSGYDAIAFPTGLHQIDLNTNPLRTRVESIEFEKEAKREEISFEKMSGAKAYAAAVDDLSAIVIVKDSRYDEYRGFAPAHLQSKGAQLKAKDVIKGASEAFFAKVKSNAEHDKKMRSLNEKVTVAAAIKDFSVPFPNQSERHYKLNKLSNTTFELTARNNMHGAGQPLIDPAKPETAFVPLQGLDISTENGRSFNLIDVKQQGDATYAQQVNLAAQQLMDAAVGSMPRDTFYRTDNILAGYASDPNFDMPRYTTDSLLANHVENVAKMEAYRATVTNTANLTEQDADIYKVKIENLDGTSFAINVPSEGYARQNGRNFALADFTINEQNDEAVRALGANETFKIEEDNLSIGGAMHKMIYDSIVPKALTKLGKSVGVAPELKPMVMRTPDQSVSYVDSEYLEASNGGLNVYDSQGNLLGVDENVELIDFDEARIRDRDNNPFENRDDFNYVDYERGLAAQSEYSDSRFVKYSDGEQTIMFNGVEYPNYPTLTTTMLELTPQLREKVSQGVEQFAAARDYPNPAPSGVKTIDGGPIAMYEARKVASSLPKAYPKTEDKQKLANARLDEALNWLSQDVSKFANPKGYVEFMRKAGVHGKIFAAPSAVDTIVNRPDEYVSLIDGGYHGDLTVPGVHEAARSGLDSTLAMKAEIDRRGEIPSWVLLLHHAWGTLSKQATPVQQEAMWLRLLSNPRAREAMQKSIDGTFNDFIASEFESNRERIDKATASSRMSKNGIRPVQPSHVWTEIVIESRDQTNEAALSIGNQVTSQANDIFMLLSRLDGRWNEVESVYRDTNSIESGRAWNALVADAGALGIKNKVQRFIGLTYGNPGLIMDRWKFVEFWLPDLMASQGANTPREFFKYNLNTAAPTDPTSYYGGPIKDVEQPNPYFSLAFYEGMEKVLQESIEASTALTQFLGPHANVGGLHWHGWNAIKNEAVGHSSLDLTYDLMQGNGVIDADAVGRAIDQGVYFTETQNADTGAITRLTLDRGTIRGEIISGADGQQPRPERPPRDGQGTRSDQQDATRADSEQERTSVTDQGAAQRDIPEPSASDAAFAAEQGFNVGPVYHGTAELYDQFQSPTADLGIHFGSPNQALWRLNRAQDDGSPGFIERTYPRTGERVIGVYVKQGNPLRMRDIATWDDPFSIIEELKTMGFDDMPKINTKDFTPAGIAKQFEAIRDYLSGKGYDGIVYQNDFEGLTAQGEATGDSYIAFDPEDIMMFSKGVDLQAAKRSDTSDINDETPLDDVIEESVRILSEDLQDLDDFIADYEARSGQAEGEVTIGVPRLANISGDEKVRQANSIVQWAYDKERERMVEDDIYEQGIEMADTQFEEVKAHILEKGARRESLGNAVYVHAAKTVLGRVWRDAIASNDMQALAEAQVLSHAYQRTRTEAARELAAGRDPSKTPAERHAEMISSFLGFSGHGSVEQRRLNNMQLGPQRRDRVRELHRLVAAESDPQSLRKLKRELATLKEELKAVEVDAKIQQKKFDDAANVLGTYGVTLRDVFDGDRIRAARQAPAVKAAVARMGSKAAKETAKMLVNRQPDKKIAKKLGISVDQIAKIEQDFRKALRLEFGKAAQGMAERQSDGKTFDQDVLVEADIRNKNTFNRETNGQFDITDPRHAAWAARSLASVFNGNAYNAVSEYWINAILSGPQTHAVNIGSNAINIVWDKTLQTMGESIVNLIIPGDKAEATQIGDMRRFWKGFWQGAVPAARNAIDSFKSDGLDFFEAWAMREPAEQFDVSKVEGHFAPSIKGRKGKIIRTPGNALQAMDTFFKTMISQGEVAVQAYRIANAQMIAGDLKEDQMQERIAELMEHGSPAWTLAVEKAKELTFTNSFDPDSKDSREKLMVAVQRARSGRIQNAEHSGLKLLLTFLFPFIRTPYRIFQQGLRKSPIGAANLIYKLARSGMATYGPNGKATFNANYGDMGRRELIRDITEQGIAGIITALLYSAAEGDENDDDKPFLIVGSRPYNRYNAGERALANRMYGGAQIIRIGGKNGMHIAYGRYEPISTILTSVVDLIAMRKQSKEFDLTMLSRVYGSILQQTEEKTFLQGFRTITDAFDFSRTIAMEKDATRAQMLIEDSGKDFLRGFVPNLLRQPLRQLDPIPRARSGYLYSLTNAGAFGLPKRDLYGRDFEKTLSGPARIAVTTPLDVEPTHPGDRFLSALVYRYPEMSGKLPSPFGSGTTNKYKGADGEYVDMTDAERNYFQKISGGLFDKKVRAWADPIKFKMPTEDHLSEFKSLLSEARREAKDKLFINGRYVGPQP